MKEFFLIRGAFFSLLIFGVMSFTSSMADSPTVFTITKPGYYSLSGARDLNSPILSNGVIIITASNVLFDMAYAEIHAIDQDYCMYIAPTAHNVVISNGMIRGYNTRVGVSVAGGHCQLENIDVIGTTTGFLFDHSSLNSIIGCRADSCSAAGFSLISSSTNSIQDCQVLTITGQQNVYGFSIVDGESNVIDSCSVIGVQTNSGLHDAYGFYSVQGVRNSIVNTSITNVNGLYAGSRAYGIMCDAASLGNTVTNNSVQSITNFDSNAVGISVNSSDNFVAKNYVALSDVSYDTTVATQYVTSQANARGAYNIAAAQQTPDTVEVINSKIDIPAPCSLTPIVSGGTTHTNKQIITGPSSLIDSGDYCLSADLTGGDIVISGNNISLDLNGYTVYNGTYGIDITGSKVDILNGTIQGSLETGVRLRSAKCTLSSLDVVHTKTGYLLSGAAYNQLNNCRALDCTLAGFSLETDGTNMSAYNTLDDCQAINTAASTTSVAGFAATGGYANAFESCTVDNVINSKTSPIADAQGFRLYNETNSDIIGCSVDGVSAIDQAAYGIRLTTTVTSVVVDTAYANANNARAIAWLKKSGQVRYLALANTTQVLPGVRILKYDGTSLTSVATINTGSVATSVAWTTMGENNYVAYTAGTNVFVYQFVLPDQLYFVASPTATAALNSCAWLALGASRYLAVGGANGGGGEVHVYPFTGIGFGAVINLADPANTIKSVDWVQSYLATVNSTAVNNVVAVYNFSGGAFSPTSPLASENATGIVNAVKWLAANDGNYYLAIASANGTVYIYRFTYSTGVATFTLVTSVSHGASVNTVSWLPVNKQFNYLAIGGAAGSGGATARVYTFNGTSLGQVFAYTSATTNGIDWFGSYLALAQTVSATFNAHVLNGDSSCLNCLVDSNTVTNVHGGRGGIGYAISEPNLFINNVGYNNDSNFYPQQQNQDNGNQGF